MHIIRRNFILLSLLFSFFIFHCNKDEPTPSITTYQVTNQTDSTINDVATYFWTGTDIEDYILHSGNLFDGESTPRVETARQKIDIAFDFDLLGRCLVMEDFNITSNQNNIFTIQGSTLVDCI